MKPTPPKSFDEYLAGASPEHRALLQKLRKTVHAAAPGAEECISYGLAAFRLKGRPLVAFGAWDKHCAFYPMSSTTLSLFEDELSSYETSKGTVRFTAKKPLPPALVRKLVKSRVEQIQAKASSPAPPRRKRPARPTARPRGRSASTKRGVT